MARIRLFIRKREKYEKSIYIGTTTNLQQFPSIFKLFLGVIVSQESNYSLRLLTNE